MVFVRVYFILFPGRSFLSLLFQPFSARLFEIVQDMSDLLFHLIVVHVICFDVVQSYRLVKGNLLYVRHLLIP